METRATEEYIPGEELKNAVHKHIDQLYEERKQVITAEDMENSISGDELIAAVCSNIENY